MKIQGLILLASLIGAFAFYWLGRSMEKRKAEAEGLTHNHHADDTHMDMGTMEGDAALVQRIADLTAQLERERSEVARLKSKAADGGARAPNFPVHTKFVE